MKGEGQTQTGFKIAVTLISLSPSSKARREVANLTERKNLHTHVYGVKEFVCLSVCYLSCLAWDQAEILK